MITAPAGGALPTVAAVAGGGAASAAACALAPALLPAAWLGDAGGVLAATATATTIFAIYLLEPRLVLTSLGAGATSLALALGCLLAWPAALLALEQPLARALAAEHPAAITLLRSGAGCLLAASLSAIVVVRTAKGRRPAPARRTPSDGPYTARWMGADEQRAVFGADAGVIVGQFADGALMRLRTDGHIATIAGTRVGKGVSAAIPNLLTYPGSVIVFDPKGENYLVTARARRSRGRRVYLLDPFGRAGALSGGAAIEDRIDVVGLLDPAAREVVADAAMVALLCATQRQGSNAAGAEGHYFDQEGMDLIRTLLLFLVGASDRELGLAGVRERSLRALRELCTRDHESLLILMQELQHHTHIASGVVARSAEAFAKMHFRQWGGVIGTSKEFTNWLADPAVADALSSDGIDVEAILAGKADLYMVVPFDTLQVYRPLPRLLIGLLLTQLQRRTAGPEILVMIDELPQLGYVPPLEAAVFAAAGYGARLWLLIQDHDRFRAVYGRERAESILNMMDVIQVFTVSGTAAKGVAEALGDTTIMRRSEAASSGSQHRGLDVIGHRSDGINVSHGEHNRLLMTPDEISRLGHDQSILLVRGHPPVRARRVRYHDHDAFQGRFDRNPLHTGQQRTWDETAEGVVVRGALADRHAAIRAAIRVAGT